MQRMATLKSKTEKREKIFSIAKDGLQTLLRILGVSCESGPEHCNGIVDPVLVDIKSADAHQPCE